MHVKMAKNLHLIIITLSTKNMAESCLVQLKIRMFFSKDIEYVKFCCVYAELCLLSMCSVQVMLLPLEIVPRVFFSCLLLAHSFFPTCVSLCQPPCPTNGRLFSQEKHLQVQEAPPMLKSVVFGSSGKSSFRSQDVEMDCFSYRARRGFCNKIDSRQRHFVPRRE